MKIAFRLIQELSLHCVCVCCMCVCIQALCLGIQRDIFSILLKNSCFVTYPSRALHVTPTTDGTCPSPEPFWATRDGVTWGLLKTDHLCQQSPERVGPIPAPGTLQTDTCSRLVAMCDLGLVAALCGVMATYPAGLRDPALVRPTLLGEETVPGREREG